MGDTDAARSRLSRLGGRPRLGAAQAADLLLTRWGVTGEVTALPSERDQNWLARTGTGTSAGTGYVLKIANADDDAAIIDLQQRLMGTLTAAGVTCPQVVPTRDGAVITTEPMAWLITLVPGRTLASEPHRPPALLRDLGELLGRVQTALAGFDLPAAHRHLQWDVCHAAEVFTVFRDLITDAARVDVLSRTIRAFEDRVVPALPGLPRAVIHNDANDHNVLVADGRITGLIDFGDAVHTVRVNELAIGCAYAMLDAADPHAVADAITSGFLARATLDPDEIELLPDLIRTRLATSVCISAHQRTLVPDDDYLRVSETPAWRLLTRLTEDR